MDDSASEDDERSVLSRRTLSDLSVNAVPILVIGAFVGLFALLAPGAGAEPLVGFHAALIGGVLLVSYVAARAIAATGEELDGEQDVQLYGDDES